MTKQEVKDIIQKGENIHTEFIDEDFFSTVIYFNDKKGGSIGGSIGSAIGGAIGGQIEYLTDRQKEVLNLIIENNKISYRAIAKKIGINASAVLKHLDTLKEKRIITRIGGTRGYWKIIDKE